MKISIAVILFIYASASGQREAIVTVPFKLEKNAISFYCRVNEADSLKFLFDTGADGSVINRQSIGKLALKIDGQSLNIGSNGSNNVDQSSNNIITIGVLIKTHVTLTVIPYQTTAFDGVFGTDLMKDNIIEIDYTKNELRFYDPKTYTSDLGEYDKCRLYFPGNYLSVKSSIVVKGRSYRALFGLDTGAANSLTLASPFVSKNDLAGKTVKIGSSTSQGSDGSSYETAIVVIPEIKFGKKMFYRIPADLSVSKEGADAAEDKAGFFGNSFLKRFNIVLDISGRYIYFKPNRNLYTSFFD